MPRLKSKVSDEVVGQFTSMIDMVFLLVIFFIVQPFKEQERRMKSEIPQENTSMSEPTIIPPIHIQVMRLGENSGGWRVDNQQLHAITNHALLPGIIRKQANDDTSIPVTIAPDARVKVDYVLKALDACALAGMQKVGFAKPQYVPGQ